MNISIQSKTASLRGFALLALGCGLIATAQAQLNPVIAISGAGVATGSKFGYSVGLSADATVAIVGGPGSNSSGGTAWISTRSGANLGTGVQLTAGSGAVGPGQQGYAVGISGDGLTAIVGAPYDTAGGANAGAFWIYTSATSGGTYSEVNHTASGGASNMLGAAVALSSDGNTVIVGAPGGNFVYVYTRSGGTLHLDATLTAAGTLGFGTSVALSSDGDTALVGAPSSNGSEGGAWVFTRSGGLWSGGTQLRLGTGSILAGRQGMAVSLSANGQRALVGGYNTSLAGAAWTYNLSSGVWSQEAQLAFFSTSGTDAQGAAVSLSGDGTLATVGAYNYSGAFGAAVEFQRTVNATTQVASWNYIGGAQGNAAGWQCGFSLAIAPVSENMGIYGCPGVPTAGEVATLGAPDLAIANVHNGTFSRGASGSYTIHVSNVGGLATYGGHPVTVVDSLPASVSYTGFSGSNWSCSSAAGSSGTNVTCTNNVVLGAGAAFGDLVLNVNVSSTAPVAVPAIATVSGGGEVNLANDTATDLVQLPQAPDLAITLSRSGDLYKGRIGVPYTITVINIAPSGSTTGPVTVTDILPTAYLNHPYGLTNAGNLTYPAGWSCSGGAVVSCSTSNALVSGTAYVITFTANVSGNGSVIASLTNTATVSGGGEINPANNTATNTGSVGTSGPDLTISVTHTGNFKVGQPGTYWIAVTNSGAAPTSGSVLVTDILPVGLSATAASGQGWSCSVGTPVTTCTRHDVLPAGLSYHIITLTVGAASNSAASSTDTATVSGGADSILTNNTATDVTYVAR